MSWSTRPGGGREDRKYLVRFLVTDELDTVGSKLLASLLSEWSRRRTSFVYKVLATIIILLIE